MVKLPVLSGLEVVKALSKIGFEHVRTRGSHAIMNKQTEFGKITVPVPLHHELAKGTLKSILRQTNLSVDDLVKLL